jgi:predicted DNA-binding transcriptional regulator YafY
MGGKKNHQRRSQWQVVNRCLNILLRLMRGSASSQELLKIVQDDAFQDGEELLESASKKRFEEDRARLREWFALELHYDRSHNAYTIVDIGRPLLDLPESAVRGLAFLEQTFSDDAVPMQAEVQQLLAHIKMLLPHSALRNLKQQRGLLEVDLKARDTDVIRDDVFEAVQTTCAEQRQLEFEYLSPQQEDEQARRHYVEPMRYFFDTMRGHYYLEAYCIEARGPYGAIPQNQIITYRLGRMQNPQPLPRRFLQRHLPEYPLDYVLSANVARLGATQRFLKAQVFPNDDGSVTVHAISHNLFFDLRTLLHYGDNCRVIGGEEAVRKMKQIVKDLSLIYPEE